jgi:hypothetical protein
MMYAFSDVLRDAAEGRRSSVVHAHDAPAREHPASPPGLALAEGGRRFVPERKMFQRGQRDEFRFRILEEGGDPTRSFDTLKVRCT